MNTLGAMVLATSDVDLFGRPSRRSKRGSEHRRPSIVRRVLDGLARAANEPAMYVPPLRQYPY